MEMIKSVREALHNFNPESGASDSYCKGIAVGIVSTLIDFRLTFNEANEKVKQNLPEICRPITSKNYPESWIN
jgi:hypothetical protein